MLPPLKFEPLFKNYLWGGRRLQTLLGKSLGEGPHWAESWELVDHGDDQSRVVAGPFAGQSLGQIVAEHGTELFGRHTPQKQFPLLLKYLDAHQTLSVQVHPNDQQGARLTPPDLGKTEAWIVLHAAPGSLIYAGLRPGVDRAALAAAIDNGTSEECLHAFEPQVGDCVFIEAGTVHALGAGLVIAEIQQASNTTFRLFDWNRVDAQGNPRPLHIQQSLETINFQKGPVVPAKPQQVGNGRERLVACDKFVLERWRAALAKVLRHADRFHIVTLCVGSDCRVDNETLKLGETLLVPASCPDLPITGSDDAVLLVMYLPDAE